MLVVLLGAGSGSILKLFCRHYWTLVSFLVEIWHLRQH